MNLPATSFTAGEPSEPPSEIVALLERFVSSISARAMARAAMAKAERDAGGTPSTRALLIQLEASSHILIPPSQREEAVRSIRAAMSADPDARAREPSPATADCVRVQTEADLNPTRVLVRDACQRVGLRGFAEQKIVTAVSEVARNIARYVGDGEVCLRLDEAQRRLIVVARDQGPGIANLDLILSGGYRSKTGLGRGILGIQKLADDFDIQTGPSGTTITLGFAY